MHLVTLLSAENVQLYSCVLMSPRQSPNDPPQLGRPSLVFSGSLRITATEGREIAYLKIGSLSHPLMMRTRIWRVRDTLIFSQPTPTRFWTLAIPFGRIDLILSQVCNLQPKVNVSEPVKEEAADLHSGPSAAVLDAQEMCRKRVPSNGSPYLGAEIPRRNTSLRGRPKEFPSGDPDASVNSSFSALESANSISSQTNAPARDAHAAHAAHARSPSPSQFEDPQDTDHSTTANTTKYSFLDSDTDEDAKTLTGITLPAGLPTIADTPEHATAAVYISTPPQRLEQPFTPTRGSSLRIPQNKGLGLMSPTIGLESQVVPVPPTPLAQLTHSSTDESLGMSPGPGGPASAPHSPVVVKNPVFIATPTQTFEPVSVSDELFAPDPLIDSFDASMFRHPLVPGSMYRLDSARPALRSKDLVRIGTHASNSDISTVGAYISWQMINRICSSVEAGRPATA